MVSLLPLASTLATSCSRRWDPLPKLASCPKVPPLLILSVTMSTTSAATMSKPCPSVPLSSRPFATLRMMSLLRLFAPTISAHIPIWTRGTTQSTLFRQSRSARSVTFTSSCSTHLEISRERASPNMSALATSPVSTSSLMRKHRKILRTASTLKSYKMLTSGPQVSQQHTLLSKTGMRIQRLNRAPLLE